MRRSTIALASTVPRHVWDPKQHDPKWVDSFAKPIADRRVWPAKQYSIGIEPQTPADWLMFSKRNLAYGYNAAMRACATFPEMIPYYQEMKRRGVLLDIDTMFVMLSRAARYDKIHAPDVFKLYDEMTLLGAKTDIAVAEVLQTLWEHSAAEDAAWREARRRQLIEVYQRLAMEDVRGYGAQGHDKLMLQQVARYRQNLKSLGGRLHYDVWAVVVGNIRDPFDFGVELTNMLWDRCPDGTSFESPSPAYDIPLVEAVLRRATDGADDVQRWAAAGDVHAASADDPVAHFEDVRINEVFTAAVSRIVDEPLEYPGNTTDFKFICNIVNLAYRAGVLLSADLMAQLMDVVKFNAELPLKYRERDAMKYVGYANRAAMRKTAELPLWYKHAHPLDARVVGRYLAARDPWSASVFNVGPGKFGTFDADPTKTVKADGDAAAGDEDAPTVTRVIRSAKAVKVRWADVKRTIASAKAPRRGGRGADGGAQLTADQSRLAVYQQPHGVELFTGQAVFLRNMYAAEGRNFEVCGAIFDLVRGLKNDIDAFFGGLADAAAAGDAPADADADAAAADVLAAGPETECWEALVLTLRAMLDYLADEAAKASTQNRQADVRRLFEEVQRLRAATVDESRERFGGKFAMLWLQEA
jgi:hypothetical protein